MSKITIKELNHNSKHLLFETIKFYDREKNAANFAASYPRQIKAFLNYFKDDEDLLFFTLHQKGIIGFFNIMPHFGEIEIFLLPHLRYKGLGSKCLIAMKKFLANDSRFDELDHMQANPTNKEMISALKKAGFWQDIDFDWYKNLRD